MPIDPKLFTSPDSPTTPGATFGNASNDEGVSGWFHGFARSAIESIPELIGIDPSNATAEWRQDHPVGGFTSQLLGTAVPYAGWFRAAKAIGPLAKAAEALGKAKNPFVAGAASTAATLLPFEAGRVAANAAVGDQSFEGMLGATTTDLALGSGVGGLLHGISSAGTRGPKLASIFPGLDVSMPLPLQARQMRSIIDSGKLNDNPEMLSIANRRLTETLDKSRGEELPRTQKYIGPTDVDYNKTEFEQYMNRLFRTSAGDPDVSTMRVRKFAAGSSGFSSIPEWNLVAREANLPEGFEEHGQYFRNVTFNKYTKDVPFKRAEEHARETARVVNNHITKSMENVGGGNFLAREADGGMFIVARKYQGEVNKASPDDKWVLFKTDRPGYFLPDQERWANLQLTLASKWLPNPTTVADAGPVYNTAQGYVKNFPLRDWAIIARDSKAKDIIKSLLPQNLVGKSSELGARFGEAVSEYFTPRLWQLRNSSRGQWIVNGAKLLADSAETTTNELIRGRQTDAGLSMILGSVRGEVPTGIEGLVPVKKLFDDAGEEAIQEWHQKIWKNMVPVSQLDSMMVKGDILPATAKLAKGLEAINDWKTTTTQKVEVATGRVPTEYPPGLYGLPRTWEGDTRFIVSNDAGETVGHVGGPNKKAARKAAEKLVGENPGWRIDPEPISLSQDPAGVSKAFGGKNNKLLEQQNFRGFKGDLLPQSKEEILKDYENATRRQMNYQANMTVSDTFDPHMAALAKEDPSAFRIASGRLLDLAGQQSEFSKIQNKIADHLLAPMVGANSASRIVSLTNSAMMHFTLGAMKLAYPVVNALQFVQTVNPEAAFLLGKAPDIAHAPDYSHFAAGGTKGPVGSLSVLSPLKMMYSSVQEMRKPSPELKEAFVRAANDRVIEPRMVEEYVGASASKLSNLRAVLKGKESFTGWLTALSEFLPAETERLSRTHAFTVGYKIARDFLKSKDGGQLNPDQLYSFAKQFTERTMYLYGTADRPRVFTTPAGSALGLFKNWAFHYMAAMGEYTKEGFVHGNFAPLLWQQGGTLALGGLAAAPLYGIADEFSKQWGEKSLTQLAYENFDEHADGILYGLPTIAGVSLTSSVKTPYINNPMKDAGSLFSIAAWGRMKSLGTATKAAFDNWQVTGEHPALDRGVRDDLIKAFAPTTIYRSLGAFTNSEAISAGESGYPIQKDPSITNRLLYAAGFNPTEIQRGYDISSALYDNHEKLKAEEKQLGTAWANAEMEGNSNQMGLIMRQGMVWGVDISKVIKNGMFEIEKHRKDIIERQLKPRDIGAWRKAMLGGEE